MKFRLWPVLSGVLLRLRDLLLRLQQLRLRFSGASQGADLDQWVRLAAGDDAAQLTQAGSKPSAELLGQLRHVLADDEASLMPPIAAAEMTQAEWDALPDNDRARYQRQQLRQNNPLLYPLTIKHGLDHRRLRR
jgi:hypothetical protein